MKGISILFFFFLIGPLFASEDSTLVERERQLEVMLAELRAAQNDTEKDEKNAIFREYLMETLNQPGAFSYPFEKLRTVGFIDSPDGLIRIINWNIELDDQTQKYFCFILRYDQRKKKTELTELIDNSYELPPRPDGILTATEWYGALYYKIIPVEKGAKTMYTLLGWDGNNSMSNIKLIDVLYFSGNDPKLGSPIFKTKDQTLKRLFYEHSEKAVMSLKYEDQYKRIIFDHLSPEAPNLVGFYSFYVPDLSYDAFVLDGNKWILIEDVIGVNQHDPNEKTEVYVKNERNGKVEKKQIKNKWVNPEDPNAPAGGSEHIAVTPDQDPGNPEAEKEKLDKKANKKDKRDPGNLNSTLGTKNKRRRRS